MKMTIMESTGKKLSRNNECVNSSQKKNYFQFQCVSYRQVMTQENIFLMLCQYSFYMMNESILILAQMSNYALG
jgi:hypothetical protein